MNDLSRESIPTATPSGWHLECLICGHAEYELVPMQEHLMDCHNLNQQDLEQSKSLPDDMTASNFVVSLSTGESYLRMLRVKKQMEIQTDNILDSVQPTPSGVIDQLLADAGDMEPVTDEQINEVVAKAKAFLNLCGIQRKSHVLMVKYVLTGIVYPKAIALKSALASAGIEEVYLWAGMVVTVTLTECKLDEFMTTCREHGVIPMPWNGERFW